MTNRKVNPILMVDVEAPLRAASIVSWRTSFAH
jgi:hypothetical protein